MNFMSTKGTEYLLIMGYLALLVPFWRMLVSTKTAAKPVGATQGWFTVPEGLHFHPGHAWATAEGSHVLRVGLDDFATRMLGTPSALHLPKVGSTIEQGESAFSVDIDGQALNVLSPVRGEVLEVNEAALRSPRLLNEDPYGQGWLFKVKVPRAGASLKSLLSGALARTWMTNAEKHLNAMMGGELGLVLQDGGVPVNGFVRELEPQRWREVAADLLLTD